MPGDGFPVETGFITMSYSETTPGWTEFEDEGPVDCDFFKPYLESEYDDLDLRIVELLRVGYRCSLIDENRCFVSGV